MRVLRDGGLPEQVIHERIRLIKGWFNDTLSKYDGQIALLHLDCDLYASYMLALTTFYEKVVSGGVILFDEFDDERWPGARKAIEEFFSDKPEKPQPHEKCDWKYFVVKQ